MKKYILDVTKEMTSEELIAKARESEGELIYIRGIEDDPLVRKHIAAEVREIAAFADVKIETNGQKLKDLAKKLKSAGLKQVVVNANTLKNSRFYMGENASIENMVAGINAATMEGLKPVRLRIVVEDGVNTDEIIDFLQLTFQHEYEILFIGTESFPEEEIRKKLPAYRKAPDEEYDVEWGKYPGAVGRVCFEK